MAHLPIFDTKQQANLFTGLEVPFKNQLHSLQEVNYEKATVESTGGKKKYMRRVFKKVIHMRLHGIHQHMYTPTLLQFLESKLQAKIHLSWKLLGSGVFLGQNYAMEIIAKTDEPNHDLDKILFIHWGKVKLVLQHNTLSKIFCHHCGSQRHPTNVCQTKYVVPEERIIRVSEELIQKIEETEWTWNSKEDFQDNLKNPKEETNFNFINAFQQNEENPNKNEENQNKKEEKTEKKEKMTQEKETNSIKKETERKNED